MTTRHFMAHPVRRRWQERLQAGLDLVVFLVALAVILVAVSLAGPR